MERDTDIRFETERFIGGVAAESIMLTDVLECDRPGCRTGYAAVSAIEIKSIARLHLDTMRRYTVFDLVTVALDPGQDPYIQLKGLQAHTQQRIDLMVESLVIIIRDLVQATDDLLTARRRYH